MIGILTFISPEGVIYITPERMLGGGDNDGMPLKEATNRGNVASSRGNSAPLYPQLALGVI